MSIIGEFISYYNDAEHYVLWMNFILRFICKFDSDNNKALLNSYHLENFENNLFVWLHFHKIFSILETRLQIEFNWIERWTVTQDIYFKVFDNVGRVYNKFIIITVTWPEMQDHIRVSKIEKILWKCNQTKRLF